MGRDDTVRVVKVPHKPTDGARWPPLYDSQDPNARADRCYFSADEGHAEVG